MIDQVEGVDSAQSMDGRKRVQPPGEPLNIAHSASNGLIRGAYAANLELLGRNKAALVAAVELILQKENMTNEELEKIIDITPNGKPVRDHGPPVLAQCANSTPGNDKTYQQGRSCTMIEDRHAKSTLIHTRTYLDR
jgi:hypothetical protein